MRMLMPAHARKVVPLEQPAAALRANRRWKRNSTPCWCRTVQLRSGGYLVINQTEALVAVDVNSGRSTRERGIEETALKTNLEAADEVARQLRLRDLAGLIVIDFIDMESRRNNTAVEKRLKDALKDDRARIQLGSISSFGLMEMSRQRLRPSLAETSFTPCPHCGGTGHVRSTETSALAVLRAIEDEGAKRRAAEICVYVAGAIALYVLNHKRVRLAEIEARYGMAVSFAADETLLPPQTRIERIRAQIPGEMPETAPTAIPIRSTRPIDAEDDLIEEEDDETTDTVDAAAPMEQGGTDAEPVSADGGEPRKRRRRRRGGRREDGVADMAPAPAAAPADAVDPSQADQPDLPLAATLAPEPPGEGEKRRPERSRRRRSPRSPPRAPGRPSPPPGRARCRRQPRHRGRGGWRRIRPRRARFVRCAGPPGLYRPDTRRPVRRRRVRHLRRDGAGRSPRCRPAGAPAFAPAFASATSARSPARSPGPAGCRGRGGRGKRPSRTRAVRCGTGRGGVASRAPHRPGRPARARRAGASPRACRRGRPRGGPSAGPSAGPRAGPGARPSAGRGAPPRAGTKRSSRTRPNSPSRQPGPSPPPARSRSRPSSARMRSQPKRSAAGGDADRLNPVAGPHRLAAGHGRPGGRPARTAEMAAPGSFGECKPGD